MAATKSLTRSESGKVRRVVVVGGGLAGLMTVIKLCEAGVPVDLFSLVPVKRSHSVCAQGGINASVNTKGEGDSPAGAPRRDGLRRRLPRQPAARQGHVRRGAGHRLHARPHGRALQPHARGPARLPPLRRHALPPHRVRRRDDRPAAPLRARRAGAPLGDASTSRTTSGDRIPGEKMVRKFEFWDFLALVLDDDGVCARHRRAGPEDDGDQGLPRRRGVPRDRRLRHRLRPIDATASSTPAPPRAPSTSRARATRTASSSRSTRPPSPAPTSCASSRRACAARAGASGSRGRARSSAPAATSPRASATTSSRRKYPGYGNLVPRDIASRELFQKCFHEKRGVFNPKSGKNENEVYLDVTHLPTEIAARRSSPACSRSTRSSSARIRTRTRCRSSPPCTTRWAASGSTSSARANGSLVDGLAAQPGDEHPGPLRRAARSTTSTTAPTASAPTRCSRASTAAWSPGPAIATYREEPGAERVRPAVVALREGREARARRSTRPSSRMDGDENPYALHDELGADDARRLHDRAPQRRRSTRCSRRSTSSTSARKTSA